MSILFYMDVCYAALLLIKPYVVILSVISSFPQFYILEKNLPWDVKSFQVHIDCMVT